MREARGSSAPAAAWPEAEEAPCGPGRGARGVSGVGRPTLLLGPGVGPSGRCTHRSACAHRLVGPGKLTFCTVCRDARRALPCL